MNKNSVLNKKIQKKYCDFTDIVAFTALHCGKRDKRNVYRADILTDTLTHTKKQFFIFRILQLTIEQRVLFKDHTFKTILNAARAIIQFVVLSCIMHTGKQCNVKGAIASKALTQKTQLKQNHQ